MPCGQGSGPYNRPAQHVDAITLSSLVKGRNGALVGVRGHHGRGRRSHNTCRGATMRCTDGVLWQANPMGIALGRGAGYCAMVLQVQPQKEVVCHARGGKKDSVQVPKPRRNRRRAMHRGQTCATLGFPGVLSWLRVASFFGCTKAQ